MLSKCLYRLAALASIYIFALRLVSYRPPYLPRYPNPTSDPSPIYNLASKTLHIP